MPVLRQRQSGGRRPAGYICQPVKISGGRATLSRPSSDARGRLAHYQRRLQRPARHGPAFCLKPFRSKDHDQDTNGSGSYMFDNEIDQRYPHLRHRYQRRGTTRCSAPALLPPQHHGQRPGQSVSSVQHRHPRQLPGLQRQRPVSQAGADGSPGQSVYSALPKLSLAFCFYLFSINKNSTTSDRPPDLLEHAHRHGHGRGSKFGLAVSKLGAILSALVGFNDLAVYFFHGFSMAGAMDVDLDSTFDLLTGSYVSTSVYLSSL